MSETKLSTRGELVRNTAVFQLKLMADGLRDLVLLPISLIASVIGLLRGGDEPDREFNEVIKLGRQSEQWINLFGHHDSTDNPHAIASLDGVVSKLEELVKQEYKTSSISDRARAEIDQALQILQDKANRQRNKDAQASDQQELKGQNSKELEPKEQDTPVQS